MRTTHSLLVAAASVAFGSLSLFAQSTAPARVEKGVRILLDLGTPLDSGTTREGDRVLFSLRNDTFVDERIAMPRGTRIEGTVIQVNPAVVNGKSKHAGIAIRLDEVVLSNGRTLAIAADVLKLEPEEIRSPSTLNGGLGGQAMSGILLGNLLGNGGVSRRGLAGMAIGGAAVIGIEKATRPKSRGAEVVLMSGAVVETHLSRTLEIPDPSLLGPIPAAPAPSVAAASPADLGNTGGFPSAPVPVEARTAATNVESSTPSSPSNEVIPAGPGMPAAPASVPGSTTRDGAFTIRVNVKLVQVDAVIHDRTGKPMTILQKEDFRIFEDGAEQQIQAFSRDELPLAVALVIDRSGSVAPLMNRIQTAAFRALQHLKASDRVSLITFAGDVTLLEPLTNNFQRVANTIGTIQAGGGTRIIDAVNEALHYLKQEAPDQRRAVILISDNVEGSSYTSLDQAVQHALETESVVYNVRISPHPPAAVLLGATRPSHRLPGPLNSPAPYDPVPTIAKDTGGEIFDASVLEIDNALATAVTRLKLRYTVGYYPTTRSASRRYHGIEIRLAERFGRPGSDYAVLSRRGYYE